MTVIAIVLGLVGMACSIVVVSAYAAGPAFRRTPSVRATRGRKAVSRLFLQPLPLR